MKKCWICGRTEKEIIKDATEQKVDGGIFDDGAKEVFFFKADANVDVCLVCKIIMEGIALDQADVKFNERVKYLEVESTLKDEYET